MSGNSFVQNATCRVVNIKPFRAGKPRALWRRFTNRPRRNSRWSRRSRCIRKRQKFSPPFSAADAPHIIGTAIAFHFVNRMVNVFLKPSPNAVRTNSNFMKAIFVRAFGALAGRRLIREAEPCESLVLLPVGA